MILSQVYFIRTVQCRYYICLSSALCSVGTTAASAVHCTVPVLLLAQQCTVLLLPQQCTAQCLCYCYLSSALCSICTTAASAVHCTVSVLLHLSGALYTGYYYCLSSAVEECQFVVRSETSSNLAGCSVTAFTQLQMSIICGLLIICLGFRYLALNWVNKTVVIYAASTPPGICSPVLVTTST